MATHEEGCEHIIFHPEALDASRRKSTKLGDAGEGPVLSGAGAEGSFDLNRFRGVSTTAWGCWD